MKFQLACSALTYLTVPQRTLGSCALSVTLWLLDVKDLLSDADCIPGPLVNICRGWTEWVASAASVSGKFPTLTLATLDKRSHRKGSRMTSFVVSGTPRDLRTAL